MSTHTVRDRAGARIVLPEGALEPRGMILIGELHGTVEMPAFVASLVATRARATR
jgi:hypothetical protein